MRADLLCLIGFCCLLYGGWLIHPAVTFIAGGGGLIALGVSMFKKTKPESKS